MTKPWIHPDGEIWLENERKLDVELMKACGVRSGEPGFDCCKVLPRIGGKVSYPEDWLLFPNYRGDKITGIKMRNIDEKKFMSKTGSQHLLYTANTNILEEIADRDEALIICEGDLDYFSWRMAGFEMVGSAPSATTKKTVDDGPPQWIEKEYDKIIQARRIIIAVDCDSSGSKLKEQMIHFLDRWRLYEVEFPEGCKDSNDVLQRYGVEDGIATLKAMIKHAQPIKVSGVRKLSEIYADAPAKYFETGWDDLDRKVRLTPGLIVLTGYSGSGKSNFLWQLNCHLLLKGWSGVAAYLENDNLEVVEDMVAMLQDIKIRGSIPMKQREAEELLEERMTFVDARQARGGGEKITTEWLVDLGEGAVLKDNIRFMVIDTWSRVSRKTSTHRSEVEQINEELQLLQDFGHQFGVVVILCAHPTKPKADQAFPPTEYDIAGARSFNDNADGVWIFHRPDKESSVSYFRNAKVRNQRKGGSLGWMEMQFDSRTRMFSAVPMAAPADWKILANGERR